MEERNVGTIRVNSPKQGLISAKDLTIKLTIIIQIIILGLLQLFENTILAILNDNSPSETPYRHCTTHTKTTHPTPQQTAPTPTYVTQRHSANNIQHPRPPQNILLHSQILHTPPTPPHPPACSAAASHSAPWCSRSSISR